MSSWTRTCGLLVIPISIGAVFHQTVPSGHAGRPESAAAGQQTPLFVCSPHADERAFCACYAPGTPTDYIEQFEQQLLGGSGNAYVAAGRWSTTATDGGTGGNGTPITLTYSFVPDYDTGDPKTSNVLHQEFDGAFGSRDAWQDLFRDIFDDWSALTGITLVEESDDGATWPGSPGVSGVRGDVRIACRAIDGANNVLAYNYFPNNGDMALDSAENWADNTDDYRFLRNIIMHEHGHGLGFDHVLPRDGTKLMEAFLNLNFEGPQDDDVRGAHYLYGDKQEPNGEVPAASSLGNFTIGTAFENLSLSDDDDVDWYSFVAAPGQSVAVRVEPVGAVYNVGPDPGTTSQIDTRAINALRVDLFDETGTTQLRSAVASAAGQPAETALVDVPAGTSGVMVRVHTEQNAGAAQRYRMVLTESSALLRTLTISASGTSGVQVALSPSDISGSSSVSAPALATYEDGTSVTLTAPSSPSGATFLRWVVDDVDQAAGQTAITIVMNADRGADAEYVTGLTVVADVSGSIVPGEAAQLSAAAVGGDAPYAYSWAPAETLSDPSSANPTATPQQTTAYVVTATDSTGDQASANVTVTVLDPLVASGGADKHVLPGMSFTLSGSASGGSGPYSYVWSPTTGLSSPDSATTTGSVNATTAYTLSVTDASGRLVSATVDVNIVGAVAITAGGDRSIAPDGYAILAAQASGGAPPYSFSWSPAAVAVEANGQSVRVAPDEDTLYTVRVSDALGQMAEDSVVVRIVSVLGVSAAASPGSITAGESTTLVASVAGGQRPYEYEWSPASGLADPSAAQTTATPVETTAYTLTVRDASNQSRSVTVEVAVMAAAPPPLSPAPIPGPCGFGMVSALPLMLLPCIALRRRF